MLQALTVCLLNDELQTDLSSSLSHFDLLKLIALLSLGFKAALQVLGFKLDRSNTIMCINFRLQ